MRNMVRQKPGQEKWSLHSGQALSLRICLTAVNFSHCSLWNTWKPHNINTELVALAGLGFKLFLVGIIIICFYFMSTSRVRTSVFYSNYCVCFKACRRVWPLQTQPSGLSQGSEPLCVHWVCISSGLILKAFCSNSHYWKPHWPEPAKTDTTSDEVHLFPHLKISSISHMQTFVCVCPDLHTLFASMHLAETQGTVWHDLRCCDKLTAVSVVSMVSQRTGWAQLIFAV